MTNAVLIGFMGSGKSDAGKTAASILGYSFHDTDTIIETLACKKISKIFEEDGEPHFRNLETQALEGLIGVQNSIISTGGGIILKKENRGIIRKIGIPILLHARVDVILNRLKDKTDRPLIAAPNKEELVKRILEDRKEAYSQSSDAAIDTSDLTLEEVAYKIKGIIESYEKNKS